ncbi:preprotein translocase subunit SecY [Denitrobaculum tricleocarpae]|uniref:Protein translocase subunit SecY n=1 Tax=Denitrobaculum tricleocarpae TaxID=2591009 RepID=A0A545U2Q4_9PROT|nr:preprotein translocase subunit SecY [Denitrobaculum tricleocarpae]TQV83736.1 preprotein translocase subunit SecY [Denitrobaculum tricleocarpae]
MASAAEQLAANMNFGALAKATELKKRIWFTLGALVIYRLGTYIPIPGIDTAIFATIYQNQAQGGVLDIFNAFSGGALERMTIFALNIMPYISASIIMQLLTAVSPQIEALKKEGEAGRKKINQYTRYGTVVLAAVQAFGIAKGLETLGGTGQSAVIEPGLFFQLSTVITLTGGTIFLMWLGEQITQRGVGNGISLIIFSGIVANLPIALAQAFSLGQTNALAILVPVSAVAIIAFIVFVERAHRRIIVQYPKRQVGNKMFGGEASHLPMKLNVAGVIPPIFASSLLLMPLTAAGFSGGAGPEWLNWVVANLGRGSPGYLLIFSALIIFFAFFYTSIVFNPEDTADNLKKHGGFIPGIRPGKNTATYLEFVLNRLTVVGACYLALVCLVPEMVSAEFSVVTFYFGGTSLLIIVSVTMDTVGQIHSHLLAHQYEGLIKKSKLKGRRG